MDYLSYFFNMQAFVGCVERLLDLEIPPRAKYLRVIHLELNRIHSHLVWLGTSALELGATDEGAPGERIPKVFYGAYVRDLDGNKLCFMEMKVG